MQNETEAYGIPADRLTYTHQEKRDERELGEAQIVSTRWGKTKVRIVHADGGSKRSPWLLLGLFAVVALAGGAVAWMQLHPMPAEVPAAEPLSNEPRLILLPTQAEDQAPAQSAAQASRPQPGVQTAAPEAPAPAPRTGQGAAQQTADKAGNHNTPAAHQPAQRESQARPVKKQPAAVAPKPAASNQPAAGVGQDQPAKRATKEAQQPASREATSAATTPAPAKTNTSPANEPQAEPAQNQP